MAPSLCYSVGEMDEADREKLAVEGAKLIQEEVDRHALIDNLMQQELGVLDKYRVLETLLADVRKQHGTGLSEEEDAVLDQMDWLWRSTERKAVEAGAGAVAEQAEKFKAYGEWLKTKGSEYAGHWVALTYVDGKVELAVVGPDVTWVLYKAWKLVQRPFIHHIQEADKNEVVT